MPVRTAGDVEDRLDESLAWRRTELLALRRAIDRAHAQSANSPLERALVRSGVALLYAHWEGFFKDACQAYVDLAIRKKPNCGQLSDGLLLSVMRGLHRRLSAGDPSAASDVIEAVRRPDTMRARIPRDLVGTRSNLRHSVAEEILRDIGVAPGLLSTRGPLIDKALCDARNTIAHGREHFPTSTDFLELHSEVLDMMGALRGEIAASARSCGYLYAD